MTNQDIFSFVKAEESAYQTQEIQLSGSWSWNMKTHLMMSFNFIHGMFMSGENDWTRVFKKIIQPILNFRYAAEDIEVRDILLYVEDPQGEHLSFLLKKYHDEVFVKENNLDEFIDDANESDIDYGGILVQDTGEPKPDVLPLHSIAFCDQTSVLGGPIGFKHYFSPNKLREMKKYGWGDVANGANVTLEELIRQSEPEKDSNAEFGSHQNKTTGKNVEVYIVRGEMPQAYLKDDNNFDDWYGQVQIVAFYETKGKKDKSQAILYRKKEKESPLKFYTANKKVYGRGLGVGGAEELFHNQIWTNFLEIHKMKLLEAASKVLLYSDDPAYANRNKINEMEMLEMTTIQDGKVIRQVPTAAPTNIQLFERAVDEFYGNAQQIASAFDPLLGQPSPSGTPFRSQNQQVIQGRGPHERRKGKFAKILEEVYRDTIIPRMAKEIVKGKKFLTTLSSEEMEWVTERMAEKYANKESVKEVTDGQDPPDREVLKQEFREKLAKKGNKRWVELLKGDFENVDIKISINIAGKQKDLGAMVDKLVNMVQQGFASPQVIQKIIQASGLNPLDFPSLGQLQPAQAVGAPQTLPEPELAVAE